MARVRAFIAMVLLSSFVLVLFYSTLNLQPSPNHKVSAEDIRVVVVKDIIAELQSQQDSTVPPHFDESNVSVSADVTEAVPWDVSVSASFRKDIPQTEAYWNRLLHNALRQLDKGERLDDAGWSHCMETNQEVLQTNVHDFSSYPALHQEFLRGMKCRYPPILIDQPNKCSSGEGEEQGQTFLLFAIKSSPRNFEQRQAVRETWGKDWVNESGLRVRTLFLLGRLSPEDPDLSQLLSVEAKLFGDLLQWDFHESFFNLTLKMNALLKWSLKNCPHVSFVFSGDDDVFVNTPAMLSYLQSLEPSKASRSYIGQIISTASPLRDSKNKYYVPLSFYDGPYPAYAGGGGFLISGALMKPLYYVSQVIPLFPIDDVYTGMCIKALEVTPEGHSGFHTFDVQEQNRGNMCVHKNLILIHQRSPWQIKRIWKGIHSPLLRC
ncbi:N-acetyllactosaminide beta-1,3-N-acetylglucosaminyltransferase 2 [Myripristis murdjan]|uniref:Hexosyltransferase n=1 Tax=Myripristis murdjan TaxID=586833 RepID=A0A667XJL1_9TELE|nr:N-acetyllactosaminide beta-1,3-N-acetylglucosaminyltransferase 2-like [Myripristis murdjan]